MYPLELAGTQRLVDRIAPTWTIAEGRLRGEMFRLDEPTAPTPHFTMKDAFEVAVRPSSTRNQ